MIIITGTIDLKPDHRDEGIALGCEHSERSRAEPGCISHDCYVAADNPNRLHFFERWSDGAAVKQHFAVPESGAFVREISGLASAAPEISIYAAEAIEGAPF